MNNPELPDPIAHLRRHARARWLLHLVLLALPAVVEAQFNYTITNGTVTITGYTGPGGAVTIPDMIAGLPVTRIGPNSFRARTNLTSIIIGNNVTDIGDYAFWGYGNLASVIIPNSVTNIGEYAFYRCTSLTSVTIPTGITGIEDWTFFYCISLTNATIPNGVTSIGQYAFDQCTHLANVTIPNSVTNIGQFAFYQCTSLTSVTIPAGITGIGDWTFFYCISLTNATILNGVTSIGQYAFDQCTHLANVTIPNSVTNIAYAAFDGCSSLTSVQIPTNVTSITDASFEGCYSLTNVTIPNNVTNIGSAAFDGCSSLTSVTISSNVTSIGGWAFLGCTSLSAFTVDALNSAYSSLDGVLFNKSQRTLLQYPGGRSGNYTIPNGVTNIDSAFGAFRFCFYLTSVTIPDTISTIGDWTFQECLSLTNVTIPSSVTRIGDFALHWCTSLSRVAIPSSVTSIGNYAFDYDPSLATIMIPASVTNLGNTVFRECASLREITVDVANPAYSSVEGILFDKSKTTLIECPGAKAGSYTVPDSVTSIQGYAFESCTALTSVTIPNSVTNIGDVAFSGCSSLRGIYFGGNAPSLGGSSVFDGDNNATVYYLQGTAGWSPTFGGRPTAVWHVPAPVIQRSPLSQTAEVGATALFRVGATNALPLWYVWYFNQTNFIASGKTPNLQLTNVQWSQSGDYTAAVTNATGSVTSPPALLNVIAPVQRRIVPALTLMGPPGTSLNLDFTAALGPAGHWMTLDHVPLTAASQWFFDLNSPLPPQGFYRASQPSGGTPVLSLNFVPALTLTGIIGSFQRVDYINQFGPTDAWVTLATVTLTNTTQLYFDTSAIRQPPRLWRLVPMP